MMKKRILSMLLSIVMVVGMLPMQVFATTGETEPQESQSCTCDTACTAEAMNSECAVCGAEGATVEGCGKYSAPAPVEEPQEETKTCTCETACTTEAMNQDCAVCSADGATVESCSKYVAPAVCTCETACTAEDMNSACAVCGAEGANAEDCGKYVATPSDTPVEGSASIYEIDTAEKLLQFGSDETSLNAVLTADITLTADSALTIPAGATLTVPEGKTLSAMGGVANNGTFTVNGTLVLPSSMYKSLVMELGITGTGSIKFGNAHIDTEGNCITHNWTAKIRQKDTTCHYTEVCTICNTTNEATVASCEYDNACDTNCNICKIVRTIEHQYDETGFCTVCRYSDTAAEDTDGDGYVEIDNAGKLYWFTHQVKDGQNGLNAELTANIDLSGTCGEGIGNWLPIGNKYSGHFNGQGFTISNLYIESDEQYAGLFGYVKGATIENVRVTGTVSSTFYSTYDPDTYESFDGAAGGVVAHLDGGTIRNCESNVTVTGGYEFGGICGRLSSGIIEDCINRGTIIRDLDSTDTVYYGGIVGYMRGGTVRGCTNHYGVSGSYATIGGIVGMVGEGTVENCINLSNIAGTQYTNAGGIAGKLWIYGAIRNCGNLGTVTGDYTDYVGGITGCSEGDIEHCWNIASFSGTSEYVGPIAGLNRDDYGVITNSYYLSDTTTEDGGRTAAQFASGQVAYELNGSTTTDESVWKQTLGTDSYPALSGELVYYGTPYRCDGVLLDAAYSNSPISESIPPHSYDESGLCSVCATQAIASVTVGEEVNFYLSFADALAKAEEGSEAAPAVIKLITEFTVDEAVIMTGGYATLDLNGKAVTFTGVSESHYITFDSATVTFEDSSTEGTGKITFDLGNRSQTIYCGVALTNASTLTVNGGTYYAAPCYPFLLLDGSTMEQNGGTITPGVYVDNGKYILNDGYLNGCFYSRTDGDSEEYRTDLVLNGGTMEFSGRFVLQRNYPTSSTITITGGIYNSGYIIRFETPDEMKLSGGTFSKGIRLDSFWEDYDTLKEILAPGYAFYDADGNLVALTEDQTEIAEYVTVGVCTHEYVYTAEGNVITESCANLACTHSATATISVESTDYNYNGMAHPATVTYSDGWKGGELTVIYQGTAVDGSDYAVNGPVSAGIVTASITIQDATASIEYPIGKTIADPGDVFVAAPETVYHSTALADIVLGRTDTTVPGTLALDAGQSLSIGRHEYQWTFTPEDLYNYSSSGGTVYITVVEDTLVSIAVTTPPEKTTYTYGEIVDKYGMYDMVVTATYASGKTEVIDNDDLTITPRELTVADTYVTITYQGLTTTQEITVNPKAVNDPYIQVEFERPPYTGIEICPEVRVYEDRTAGIEIPASEYQVTYTNNIQLGTATITITDVAGGNYDISGSITFEIVKATLADISVSQNGTLTYTGEAQTPSVNASATTADGAAVTFTYCLTEDGTYTAELPTFTNAGTYTVYYRITAANHEDVSGSFEVVVEQADNEVLAYPSIADWTYGETPSTPVGKAKWGEFTFTYGTDRNGEFSSEVPTEAGKYWMRCEVVGNDNWEGIGASEEPFTIHKAPPTADLFDFTQPANLNVCDGLAKEAMVTVKDGVQGVGSITVKYFKDGTELDSAPMTVGTYTVKIEVAEGANYKPATLTSDAWTFTFDITNAADHTNVALVPNSDGTHDKVCTVCQAVLADNAACAYEAHVQNPNAGNLIAAPATCISGITYYKSCNCGHKSSETFVDGEPNGENHTETGTELAPNGNGTHNEVRICCEAVVTENVACTPTLADDTCLTEAKCACGHVIQAAQTAHDYRYTASSNTLAETCRNTGCTVHTATAAITAPVSPVYNGAQHAATVTYSEGWAGGDLDVTYSASPVNAGEITARITTGGVTAEVTYIIGKATPDVGTVSVADSTTIYPHTALTNIQLKSSKTLPDGTLALDAGQILTVGTKAYNWTFEPTDAANYNEVKGTVSITVTEDTQASIVITTPPTKTTYTYGEVFDKSGMVVTATFASGLTANVTDSVAITPDTLTVETTAVTISYEGKTITQDITVNPKSVTAAVIVTPNSYTYTGSAIIPTGIVVKDGDKVIPESEYTVNITGNVEVGTATITVTDKDGGNYTVNGSATFTITVASQTAPAPGEGYTVDYTAETIMVEDGYEVYTALSDGTKVSSGSITGYLGQTLYIRKEAKMNYGASDWAEIVLAGRPAAPNADLFTKTLETLLDRKDASLSGVTSIYEYKLGDGNWITGAGEVIANPENKTIVLRVKATSTAPHGAELTLTFLASTATLTVTFDANGGEGTMAAQEFGHNGGKLTANAFTRTNYQFAGWNTKADGRGTSYADESFYKPETTDLILYAQWSRQVYEVSGTITGAADTTYTTPSATLTDLDGKSYVAAVNGTGPWTYKVNAPAGTYQLVVETTIDGKSVTVTKLIELKANTSADAQLPAGEVSSVVETTDNTPPVIVGGLDEEAVGHSTSDTAVTVTLTVTQEDKDHSDTEHSAIISEAGSKVLEFFEIEIEKTVTSSRGTMTTGVQETTNLLQIMISFPTDGKTNFSIFRYHGSDVDELSTAKNADGEYITVGNGFITIHAKKYSTYAISYTEQQTSGGEVYIPSYSITILGSEHGKVVSDCGYAYSGSTVTLTVAPDEGYKLNTLTVTDRNGKQIELTDKGDGKYTFKMPSSKVDVKVVFGTIECDGGENCPAKKFADVNTNLWYHEGIDYVIINGLMQGTDKGFEPLTTTSRAMIVTILYRLEGKPAVTGGDVFADVPEGRWYSEAVLWANQNKIVEGWNGKFSPNAPITRQDLATILWRYAKHKGYDVSAGESTNILSWPDAFAVSEYAIPAMQWACGEGIINGKDGNLAPAGDASRAESATMLMRFIEGAKK